MSQGKDASPRNISFDSPVALFSGQGAQAANMGKELAEADADAMRRWEFAEKTSGLPLREIYWSGDDAAMSETAALQPALTVANLNAWSVWSRLSGATPFASAGHSLGEFAALAAAGVLSPESAIEIVSLRGRLMARADPAGKGAMAAIVRLDERQVAEIAAKAAAESGETIVCANYNTPTQTVVSGRKKAVDIACQMAKANKGRAVPLKVSGAFHSPLMDDANRELAPALEKAEWAEPKFPVYCGIDGAPVASAAAAKKNMLDQMISPVRWVTLIRNIYLAGGRAWLEIGPKNVLGKMVDPDLAEITDEKQDIGLLDSSGKIA